jgi:tetratricopeptide (TPR) repeat protein
VLRDPTSRGPERRRALKATIGWSYELLFPDDQRGLWALAVFAGGAPLAAVESVLEALEVPAAAAIDVVGRLAGRSLVIVDDADGSGRPDRYRLLDSIRAFAVEAMAEAGTVDRAHAAHARWFVELAATSTAGVRSAEQAHHLAVARRERANIDTALAWSVAHDPLLALDLVNGFGWAWIVLGDSRGAQRALAALEAAGDDAPERDRATAFLLAAWVEASQGELALARDHVAAATTLAEAVDDRELRARADYHLAYVVSHDGAWAEALALTDRSRDVYDGLDRPWDQVANGLFAARAALSAGDEARSLAIRDQLAGWLPAVDDPWLHVRHEAVLGELARVQRRFDDAVSHLDRAAATSGRLGFRQTEAYQVASLGRAQGQAGDADAAAASLARAVEKAEATGDLRLVALARVHLGRVLRGLGRTAEARAALDAATAWHREAGGGEQAALGEVLRAAMDAADGVEDAAGRLTELLHAAEGRGDAPVEVFALDALARLAAASGDEPLARERRAAAHRRMAAASHFITEQDRVDARHPA